MASAFSEFRNIATRNYFRVFLLFVAAIPISSFVSVRVLVIATILACFATSKADRPLLRSWDLLLYFVVLVIGLIYSTNLSLGLARIETSFCFIALPIVFARIDYFDEARMREIMFAFAAGLAVACMICLGVAFSKYITSFDPTLFTYDRFTAVLSSQPTYFAYYLIASIAFGLHLLFFRSTKLHRGILIAGIAFFFVVLMLTGGRTAYMSLVLIFSFFVLKFFSEARDTPRRITFSLIVVLMAAMFVVSSRDPGSGSVQATDDYWERSTLWESAIEANPSPLLGVGTGDYQQALNDYYISRGLDNFAKENYNAHNQFIQIYFSNGLLGLIVMLLILIRPLYQSVRTQNTIGVLLIFPFLIYGITEVFLGRFQGVVLFTVLHQLTITAAGYSSSRRHALSVT